MRSEVEIYRAEYIEFEITTAAGVTTFTFDNRQIRSDVEYKSGQYTELLTSPNGATSSLAINGGKEFRFTLRVFEDLDSRRNWQYLLELTQVRYSAQFTLKAFQSIFNAFPNTTPQTSEVKTIEATLSNAVIEVKDHFADSTARGVGPRYPSDVEIVVREASNISLIQLPMSALAVGSQAPCASVSISGAGSADVDGATITTSTTGVLMQWEFGSFATAQIAPGDDATDAANWIFVSGSWSESQFENRIVNNIDAGGTGLAFSLGVLPIAYHGSFTGSGGISVGLTIVEGPDTSSKLSQNLTLNQYRYLFGFFQNLPSAPHITDLALRWWSVCRALYAWGSGISEEKDTVINLTNNQHTFSSSGGKASFVHSNIDVRELVLAREYVTSLTLNDCANLETLALSEQFTPNSGGFYRDTYSNADDNNLGSLDLTGLTNLREFYAIACGLDAGDLTFGTHPNLEVVSIDHQPVLDSSLLTTLNGFSSLRKLRIGNDSGSGAISNPTINLANLEEFSAPFCNLSGTIALNTPNIKVFRIDDNAGLTLLTATSFYRSLEIASALNTSLFLFNFNQAGVREMGLPAVGSAFAFNLMTDLEKVEIENNASVTSLACGSLSTMKYFRADNCTNLTQVRVDPAVAPRPTYEHFELNRCSYDYTNPNNSFAGAAGFTDVNDCTIILTDNGMTTAEINELLVDIDSISSGGYTGRSIDVSTNSAPDSSTGGNDGTAAVASLVSKGFTVTTD